jgi:hypothetical protein
MRVAGRARPAAEGLRARGTAALAAAAAAAVLAVPLPAAAGDAARGRELYVGAAPFANGGAPCGACHAIGGPGAAFAASFGPDLSTTFDGMPADALDGLLADLPFPSMVPVYEGHALTPAERADLAAFLASVTGLPPARAGGVLGAAAAIAAAGVVALARGARRRGGAVRTEMIERAQRARGEGR